MTIPSSEGGVPFSLPLFFLMIRRPPRSTPPEPSVRRIPPKRTRTLSPGESSRHAQPDPQAIIKRPMVTVLPIEGNSDCRARLFHSELYFNIEDMR